MLLLGLIVLYCGASERTSSDHCRPAPGSLRRAMTLPADARDRAVRDQAICGCC
jgi:hypothetical protein